MTLKWEGLVGISIEIPVTLAPNSMSHWLSQDPLNPVWPVTSTDLSQ